MSFRFRTTMVLALLGLVVSIAGAVIGAVARIVERDARQSVEGDLLRSQHLFAGMMLYREELFRAQNRVMAEEPRLKAIVATDNVAENTALEVASVLRQALECDLFLLLDT